MRFLWHGLQNKSGQLFHRVRTTDFVQDKHYVQLGWHSFAVYSPIL